MMRLRSGITDAEHRVGHELTLDRQEIIFVVWIRVAAEWRGHPSLRKERRKIDARMRIACRRIQRRERQRKWLDVLFAVGGADERGREERRRGTGVAQAIRRLRFVDRDRVAFNHR